MRKSSKVSRRRLMVLIRHMEKLPPEARRHFEETLRRTPGRPKAIVGIARAAEAMGDTATARAQYTRLIDMWKSADGDRPELQAARRFLQSAGREHASYE